MSKVNILEQCKKILEINEYLCLATSDTKGNVWSNPLWYAYDDTFAFYFVSKLESKHMENILNRSQVSASIYSSTQSQVKPLLGLQLEGRATIVEKEELEHACKTYYDRKKGIYKVAKYQYIIQETILKHNFIGAYQFVKIVPIEMWLFDNEHFGEERRKVTL